MMRLFAMAAVWAALAAPALGQQSCTTGDGAWFERVCFDTPRTSDLYGHNILGDTPEWGALTLYLGPDGAAEKGGSTRVRFEMPGSIIEDIAPRLWDLDGDGRSEIVFVQTSLTQGARLVVAGLDGVHATTRFIGQPYRWLAPVGAADIDGDGSVELAYVDRPHLAKVLRVWRFTGTGLEEVGSLGGFSNHQIGQDFITGAVRDCDGVAEFVLPDSNWQRIVAVGMRSGALTRRDVGPFGADELAAAARCQ